MTAPETVLKFAKGVPIGVPKDLYAIFSGGRDIIFFSLLLAPILACILAWLIFRMGSKAELLEVKSKITLISIILVTFGIVTLLVGMLIV